jgi:hypothetical protein
MGIVVSIIPKHIFLQKKMFLRIESREEEDEELNEGLKMLSATTVKENDVYIMFE